MIRLGIRISLFFYKYSLGCDLTLTLGLCIHLGCHSTPLSAIYCALRVYSISHSIGHLVRWIIHSFRPFVRSLPPHRDSIGEVGGPIRKIVKCLRRTFCIKLETLLRRNKSEARCKSPVCEFARNYCQFLRL